VKPLFLFFVACQFFKVTAFYMMEEPFGDDADICLPGLKKLTIRLQASKQWLK
jgi:hypothetical protein